MKDEASVAYGPAKADAADTEAIFQPIEIGRLRVKNRIFRSSISGRIDNYDGSGTTGPRELREALCARGRGSDHLLARAHHGGSARAAELCDDRP